MTDADRREEPATEAVTLDRIREERAAGWVNFHPERYCHRCGHLNVWSWTAPSPLWNAVMRDPNTGDDPFEGIICPSCFALLAEESGVVPPERHTWSFEPIEREARA